MRTKEERSHGGVPGADPTGAAAAHRGGGPHDSRQPPGHGPQAAERRAGACACARLTDDQDGRASGPLHSGRGRAMSDEIAYATIRELGQRYRARQLSPVEVTRAMLARIEKLDPALNAYVTLTADRALADARAAEEYLR